VWADSWWECFWAQVGWEEICAPVQLSISCCPANSVKALWFQSTCKGHAKCKQYLLVWWNGKLVYCSNNFSNYLAATIVSHGNVRRQKNAHQPWWSCIWHSPDVLWWSQSCTGWRSSRWRAYRCHLCAISCCIGTDGRCCCGRILFLGIIRQCHTYCINTSDTHQYAYILTFLLKSTSTLYCNLLLFRFYPFESKNRKLDICPYLWQMLIDFQTSFTIRLRSDSVMHWSLRIPYHLKSIATLSCETLMFKI